MKRVAIVVAATVESGGIGIRGGLPWDLPTDRRHFQSITSRALPGKRNAVIMGRRTWESLPPRFRPLPHRLNVVLTANPAARERYGIPTGTLVADSLEAAMQQLNSDGLREEVDAAFVVGGSGVYSQALESGLCERIILTEVLQEFECDTFFRFDRARFREVERSVEVEEHGTRFRVVTLVPADAHRVALSSSFATLPAAVHGAVPQLDARRHATPAPLHVRAAEHEEYQYLDLVRDVLETGVDKDDRTGTGTLSKFGVQMRFSLRDGTIPVLTTKRVFWRGVVEELLWLVRGCTDSKALAAKKVHIWDGNGSREFLDKCGFPEREEGDLGPVYGFQWRHFGAKYVDKHADYAGQGVDQLAHVVQQLKHNPTDRRIVMSAWNPADLPAMALPPCHMFAQFYVADGELFCQMYQRSADLGLGVPFNIASYSLLTHMLARASGLKPGEFVHVIGDAHVYKNHVEPLRAQLDRAPLPFPKLRINTDNVDIDGFKYEDFELVGYECHGPIKMAMSV